MLQVSGISFGLQALIIRKVDNTFRRINLYLVNSAALIRWVAFSSLLTTRPRLGSLGWSPVQIIVICFLANHLTHLVPLFNLRKILVLLCFVFQVFHDCRLASDALFHQYHIHLMNVFDTQVCGLFILAVLFVKYLHLLIHDVLTKNLS